MMKILSSKLLKFFYGIILIPFCYTIFVVFIFVLQNIEFSNRFVIIFFGGCGTYIILHFLLYKPVRLYVIGHELMHTISALLCGAKVANVKVKKNSGSVNVNKVNTFIALSPYFVPIYSVFLIIIWGILKYVLKFEIKVEIFIFLLGMSIMFHLVLTFYAISVGQTDFNVSGWLFSLITIFIVNVIVLTSVIVILFPINKSYKEIVDKIYFETKISYIKTYDLIKNTLNYFLKAER